MLLPSSHSATPPWFEQVPLWCCDLENVPSLHLAVAPVELVFPVGEEPLPVGAEVPAVTGVGAVPPALVGATAADLVATDDFAAVPVGSGVSFFKPPDAVPPALVGVEVAEPLSTPP